MNKVYLLMLTYIFIMYGNQLYANTDYSSVTELEDVKPYHRYHHIKQRNKPLAIIKESFRIEKMYTDLVHRSKIDDLTSNTKHNNQKQCIICKTMNNAKKKCKKKIILANHPKRKPELNFASYEVPQKPIIDDNNINSSSIQNPYEFIISNQDIKKLHHEPALELQSTSELTYQEVVNLQNSKFHDNEAYLTLANTANIISTNGLQYKKVAHLQNNRLSNLKNCKTNNLTITFNGIMDAHYHYARNKKYFHIDRHNPEIAPHFTNNNALNSLAFTFQEHTDASWTVGSAQTQLDVSWDTKSHPELHKITASKEFIDIYTGGIRIAFLKRYNPGVIGLYNPTENERIKTNATLNINAQNCLNSDLCYGAFLGINTNAGKNNVIINTKNTHANGYSLYASSRNFGSMYVGTQKDVASIMRLDASSISTVDGGIDGNFFRYFNTEGYYTRNKFRDALSLYMYSMSIDVQHPFHILPRLYNEYRHVPNAPYPINGKEANDQEAIKLTAYSPEFKGFKLGISFIPDQRKTGLSTSVVNANDITIEDYKNTYIGGLSYHCKKDRIDFNVSLTGEYGTHTDKAAYHDLRSYNIGGKLGYTFNDKYKVQLASSYASLFQSSLSKQQYFINGDRSINGDRFIDKVGLFLAPPVALIKSLQEVDVTPGDTNYYTLGASANLGRFMASVNYFNSTRRPFSKSEVNEFSNLALGLQFNANHYTKSKSQLIPYIAWNQIKTKEIAIGTNNNPNNSGHVLLAGMKFIF